MELLLSLLALLAVVFSALYGTYAVAMWVGKKIWPTLKSFILTRDKRTENILMNKFVVSTGSSNPQVRNAVTAAYINASNNTSYTIEATSNMAVAMEGFIEELKKLATVNIINEWCDMGKRRCTTIVEVIGAELGTQIFLGFETYQRATIDYKGRTIFSCANNIEQYIKDGYILLSGSIEIIHHQVVGDNNPDIQLVKNLLTDWELDFIKYDKESVQSTHIIQRLAQASDGTYFLQSSALQVKQEYDIDLMYEPVKVEFGGEQHSINMSDAVEITANILQKGKSAAIFGVPGTGKSRLMQYIQSILYHGTEPVRIIMVTPGMLAEMQKSSVQSALVNMLRPEMDGEYSYRNIFCIDEAELAMKAGEAGFHTLDNTLLLQLMDGELQRTLNSSVLCIFNARPEQLNAALFRRNRLGITMELSPLTAEKGNKLAREVQLTHPELVLDTKQLNILVNEMNKTTGGDVYASSGYITIADVFSCLRERSIHMDILEAIRAASGNRKNSIRQERTPKVVAAQAEPTVVEESRIHGTPPTPTHVKARPKATTGGIAPVAAEEAPAPKMPTIAGHKKNRKDRRRNKNK